MSYKAPYQPVRPAPRRYLIHIQNVAQSDHSIKILFDIAIGPCAGYAHTVYLQAGQWPLIWYINKENGGAVIHRALEAINSGAKSPIRSLMESTGSNLTVDLELYQEKYIQIKRSFPASTYSITPNDIRIGTTSWGLGTADVIRATYLANLSRLPVVHADFHERKSPMVDWCAENNVILLPSLFSAGDYEVPGGNIIIDRKAHLPELYGYDY